MRGQTIFDRLKLDFKKAIFGNIILQVLFLIFGIVVFTNPFMTIKTVGVIIGIYFIVFGVFDIALFFMRGSTPIFNYKIIFGILAILLGIFVMVDPFKITLILTFVLGIYLIMVAIFKVLEAFKLKQYKYDGWLILLVSSIIILIFGIFTTINPLASSMQLVEVTAIFIVLSSILEICNLIMVYSRARDIAKLFKEDK